MASAQNVMMFCVYDILSRQYVMLFEFCHLHAMRNILTTIYIGWSDVTESVVTIRSPFCGYNTTYCVELSGEDFSCYSNKIKPFSLRECLYDHWLTNKAYLSSITMTNIYQSFTRVLILPFLQILPTQPFLFLLQDSLYGFPILFTVTSEHIRLFTF